MPHRSIAVCYLAVCCLGCSGSPSETKSNNVSNAPSKPDQPLVAMRGERGGRVVNLKPDNVKGEIVHDKDANSIKVYIDALKPEDVDKASFISKVGVAQVEEFPLTKAGTAWESKDAKLNARLKEGRSAKVTLTVNTKKGALVTFEYLTLE